MYFSKDLSTTSDTNAKNADTNAEYAPSTSSESHFPTKKELVDLRHSTPINTDCSLPNNKLHSLLLICLSSDLYK